MIFQEQNMSTPLAVQTGEMTQTEYDRMIAERYSETKNETENSKIFKKRTLVEMTWDESLWR
jgi:hypothetical protein